MLFFLVLFATIVPSYFCDYIVRLPEELQILLAEESNAKFSDINETTEHYRNEIAFLRALLAKIVNTQPEDNEHHNSKVEVEIDPHNQAINHHTHDKVKAPVCSNLLGCHECVANGCAWCLSQRACRKDEAWQCQGYLVLTQQISSNSALSKHSPVLTQH